MQNSDFQKEISSLIETISYAKPSKNAKVNAVEREIADKIEELKQGISKEKLAEVEDLLIKRNRLARENKEPKSNVAIFIIAGLLLLAFAIVILSQPKIPEVDKNFAKYQEAIGLFNDGQYILANIRFAELGDYEDSVNKRTQIANIYANNEVVYFGTYKSKSLDWYVLEAKDDKILLISNCMEDLPYNEAAVDVSWENSSVRQWVNNDFFEGFTDEEKSLIIENNTDGLCYDKAFLLSEQEYNKYTSYGYKIKWWWLRTKAQTPMFVKYVSMNNSEIIHEGAKVTNPRTVRPCVWVSTK